MRSRSSDIAKHRYTGQEGPAIILDCSLVFCKHGRILPKAHLATPALLPCCLNSKLQRHAFGADLVKGARKRISSTRNAVRANAWRQENALFIFVDHDLVQSKRYC